MSMGGSFSVSAEGEARKSKRQNCPIENGGCSSAQETGDLLGISERKVRQARTVMDHADEVTKEAVQQGEKSINQAYNETQKRRQSKKSSAQLAKDSTRGTASTLLQAEPIVDATMERDEPCEPQNDPSTSLGKSVTVYLPDWQYDGLTNLCDGHIDSHVRKAVDLYVESLGIQEESGADDDEWFDPEEAHEKDGWY